MITATKPWEVEEDADYDQTPPCPEDVIPDRERERLDQELDARYQYED